MTTISKGSLVRVGADAVGRDLGGSARRAKQAKDGAFKIAQDAPKFKSRRRVSVTPGVGAVAGAGGAAGYGAARKTIKDGQVHKAFQRATRAEVKTWTPSQKNHVAARQVGGEYGGLAAGGAAGAAVGAVLGRGNRKIGAKIGGITGGYVGAVTGGYRGTKRGVTETRDKRARIAAKKATPGVSKAFSSKYTTPNARKAAAKKGDALPGGGFPIQNKAQLQRAREAVGRAKDPAAGRALIRRRAKELDVSLKGSAIAKANQKGGPITPGRVAAGAFAPGIHGAIAGKKGHKVRAASYELGGGVVANVPGAAVGTVMAHNRGHYKPISKSTDWSAEQKKQTMSHARQIGALPKADVKRTRRRGAVIGGVIGGVSGLATGEPAAAAGGAALGAGAGALMGHSQAKAHNTAVDSARSYVDQNSRKVAKAGHGPNCDCPACKGKKWTKKSDIAWDKKNGVRQGSPQDRKLDKERGVAKRGANAFGVVHR